MGQDLEVWQQANDHFIKNISIKKKTDINIEIHLFNLSQKQTSKYTKGHWNSLNNAQKNDISQCQILTSRPDANVIASNYFSFTSF